MILDIKIEKNGCVLFLNIPSFPILIRNAVCSGGGWFVCGVCRGVRFHLWQYDGSQTVSAAHMNIQYVV